MSQGVDLLPELSSREAYFDYLDGRSVQVAEELFESRSSHTVGKTYILETFHPSEDGRPVEQTFEEVGLRLEAVEAGALYRVIDRSLGGAVALLELLHPRYPVVYTLLDTKRSDPWIQRLVDRTPWLDRLWLSARMFEELWKWVESAANPRRLTRLKFEYEAFFEPVEGNGTDDANGGAEPAWNDGDDELKYPTRRASRFTMVDRVETVQQQLGALQRNYQPLHSITQLRIPATTRGGHDFYFDGKVTNRSDSFADHRQAVSLVTETYRRATERAEQRLWFHDDRTAVGAEQASLNLRGAPVYLEFSTPLSKPTFDRFISMTFGRRDNRLRLSGHPFRLGATKVHVYGVDQHLWQPIVMELTHRHIYLLLPEGTCGNTVHRLVTNVQRLLDPAVQAWVGDEPFGDLIHGALPDQTVGGDTLA